MRKISRILIWLLCCLLPVCSALASDMALILSGKVEAKDTRVVSAPFGATVDPHTLKAGDSVAQGDTLLTLAGTEITAPCDGTVRGLFASAGDTAAYLQSKYGALCYLAPDRDLVVDATTAQRYNSDENRTLHIGEPVYLQHTNSYNTRSVPEGQGRITGITGDAYAIEVTSGDLDVDDTVYIYRERDFDDTSRIGRGTVRRIDPIAITGDGVVLATRAREGQSVHRGDALFEMVAGTSVAKSDVQAGGAVNAPIDGVIATVEAKAGQSVATDQTLLTLYASDTVYLACSVSEMDLDRFAVGDTVEITLDSLPGRAYEGVVEAVSGIGTLSDTHTRYTVSIAFTPDEAVRFGMSGTAYFK